MLLALSDLSDFSLVVGSGAWVCGAFVVTAAVVDDVVFADIVEVSGS